MIIGVDVGGTKTEAIVMDFAGNVLARTTVGCGNWENIGLDAARVLYADVVQRVLAIAGVPATAIVAHGWGVAGLDWPSDRARILPLVEPLVPHASAVIVNDAFLPLRAGSRFAYGIGVIAGTGSTVAGIGVDGQQYRTFGMGGLWGDFDGAYGLVYAAIQQLAVAHYKNHAPTVLHEFLCDWAGYSSLPEIAEAMSRGTLTRDLATFAPFVMQAAMLADPIASGVVTDAAYVLARNASAVAQQLGLVVHEFDVVLAGGVALGAPRFFMDVFRRHMLQVAPRAVVTMLAHQPVFGAVLLAADYYDAALARTLQSLVTQKEIL